MDGGVSFTSFYDQGFLNIAQYHVHLHYDAGNIQQWPLMCYYMYYALSIHPVLVKSLQNLHLCQ
jgi:hypothetical protein